MNDATALQILKRIDEIQLDVAFLARLWETVAMRRGISDATTLSVAEAARFFGVDASTVRRRFADALTRFPGGRRDRIPVEKIKSAFVLSRVVKIAANGEKRRKAA